MIIGISGKIGSGKDLIGSIIQYLIDYTNLGYTHPITEKDFNDYIKNKHNHKSNFKIVKYADKLKDIVCILLGCTREQLEDREFKEKELGEEWWKYDETEIKNWLLDYYNRDEIDNNPQIFLCNYKNSPKGITKLTHRKLLQQIGTDLMRNQLHPNTWVNATMVDYKESFDNFKIEKKDKFPNWIITDVRFPNEAEAIKYRGGILIRVNRRNSWVENKEKEICNYKISEHESETALDNYKFDYIIDNSGTIEELIEKVKEILIKENII